MKPSIVLQPQTHQSVLTRFIAACQADDRVVAATLYGSHANGTADGYSDLDLGLITTDADYDEFLTEREVFLRQLGEPLLLEDFGSTVAVLFILADGTEGELAVGRAGHFRHIHGEPHRVLLDKVGLLADAVFAPPSLTQAEQTETLRRLVYWFWHDLSHLITALGRRQLWWAHGQLDELRLICVNLARLRHNFADPYVADDYFKVDLALPVDQLAPLQATICPLEEKAMLQASLVLVRFYCELAPLLAQAHHITYPVALERVLGARLEALCAARL
jgi:hypothetical protein